MPLITEYQRKELPTSSATTARMRAVRTRGTRPERIVARLIWAHGGRYRLNVSDLPGRPDIANKKKRWAVFVHGCFWHGHDCRPGLQSKTNRGFWEEKIS